MKVRCGTCIYRAKDNISCDFYFITGHTRKAQPPEKCTFYKRGDRCETPKEPQVPASTRKTLCGQRTYDLDLAMQMWTAGATDREIALAIGSSLKHVAGWRHNNRLRVNPEPKANQKYDWDLAMELWKDGATDREIAEAVGAENPQYVGNWRRGKKLSANKKREA